MTKRTTKNQLSTEITDGARDWASRLSTWRSVEATANNLLKDAEQQLEASKNFVEIHYVCGKVYGVVRAGDAILKIES